MSHKIAQLTFPSFLVLRRHRYGPGQFYLNWPMWNNKKKKTHSIWEERRNFPANVLDRDLFISGGIAAKF